MHALRLGLGLSLAPLAHAFPAQQADASPPVIGAWFWDDVTLEPEGYKPFLDAAATHSAYTLISASLRVSKGELTDPLICEQIGRAVRYASQAGLRIAFDLDVRLARRAFQARYPNELQEELVLKFGEAAARAETEFVFTGSDLDDHMTGGSFPYRCLSTRAVRVYAFRRGADGIDAGTLREVPAAALHCVGDARRLTVSVATGYGPTLCAIAAHTYLTPDVFAPHLLPFQRELIQRYASLPLAGIMKDEWGFPPDPAGNPAHDRYWYSPAMAQAYAAAGATQDLIHDALLMCAGISGQERERAAAINRYNRLCRTRNAAVEDDFYQAGKAQFGAGAFIVTHPTWTPYPGAAEFRKNGLDWWEATRDLAQSDESTPYSCRTSLAKRWGSPVWYNQFYSPQAADYGRELWSAALAGGRLNVHPCYPPPSGMPPLETHLELLRGRLSVGMARLRMLDFIVQAPLDCPVAVVFGHASALNWVAPAYNRVGLELASALNRAGYPTDLLPSTLVETGALRIDPSGAICLGRQRYQAVVLYEPEYGSTAELAFWTKAAQGPTAVFSIGEWRCDFTGRPLPAASQLLSRTRACRTEADGASAVLEILKAAHVTRVTPWSVELKSWDRTGTHAAPPARGFSLLTDGTCVRIAGEHDPAGDPMRESFTHQNHALTVDAVGLFAVRFQSDGRLAALAAGGLARLEIDGVDLRLPERVDLAFLRREDGRITGIVRSPSGRVPAALLDLGSDWQLLPPVPAPLPERTR